ncbi:hypothetical protein [Actinomycetospora succinea]|nr:hypothetical protein [Actinomycetospora succinea]
MVERVASFFAEDVTDYLSDDFIKYASGLVDAEDKKIKAEVEQRINRARHLYEGLTDSEKANRRRAFFLPPAGSQLTASRYTCRACGEPAVMLGEAIRAGRVILDDDAVIRNYRVVAQEFDCTVCLLALHGAVEIGSAGMDQSWVIEEQETLEDRYTGYDDEPDYGND